MEFSELIQVTTPLVSALDSTPYLRFGGPVGRATSSAAVAAEYSTAVARPQPGTIFQLQKIVVMNESAAAMNANVRLMTSANVTTAGLASAGGLYDLANFTAVSVQSAVELLVGTHTAEVGNSIARIRLPVDGTFALDLPGAGLILYGDDSAGQAVGVWGQTVNSAIGIAFYGRQWPSPQ